MVVIFLASFGTYYTVFDDNPNNAPLAGAMDIEIIMMLNLFLVQVNSSNHDFAFKSV